MRHPLVGSKLLRRIFLLLGLALCAAGSRAQAQTTVMFEGFESLFPGFPGIFWTVGDSNAAGVTGYWNDVNAAFGGTPPHSGLMKGYCAGVGFGGSAVNPVYQNSMTATMSRTINLTPYAYANLRFWRWVPAIGSGENWRVSMDNTPLSTARLLRRRGPKWLSASTLTRAGVTRLNSNSSVMPPAWPKGCISTISK
ncbi:MAG TPA: hypothetical protein VK846_04330 [Candidatus Limnocylindria bacterium]|nr:hypothetical protein [Candidatus Limnocylindria bacterium]